MKKFMTVAVVLMMVFAFGIAGVNAQQADTKDHGNMTMSGNCPMMAKTDGMKCAMGKDGKCPMESEKCQNGSHHGSQAQKHDHGAN